MFLDRDDPEAALSLADEALEIASGWDAAHFLKGEILEKLGRGAEASDAYTRYLSLAGEDRMGAEVRLALLGRAPVPDVLPASYVEALFDDYAGRFDRALLTGLDYRAPLLLRDLVDRYLPDDGRLLRILDLGCGTGLGGEAFQDRAGWLRGVDLSENMLAEARRKGLYDELAQGDVTMPVCTSSQPFDLVLAADVLVYIGDLGPVFAAIGSAMKPGALFAFSVQTGRAADFELLRECRYGHSRAYIARLAGESGLEVLATEDAVCRREAGRDVPGQLVLLRRPALAGADMFAPSAGIVPLPRRLEN
jgi:predicted TPR repeat methyltransferase